MLIVDAQVHLWGADTPGRPWPPGEAHRAHKPYPVTKDMALDGMKEAGVDRVVIVPPSWEGDRNDLALEAARLHPDRFAVMGRLAIEKPESRVLVDGWKRQPGMLGMRFTFSTERQRPWLTDGTADWLWAAAERAGIPVMMSVAGSFAAVDRIAERHPGLRLVIDHPGDPQRFQGHRGLRRLGGSLHARATREHRGQGLGTAVLLHRALSLPRTPRAHSPGVRRVRATPDVLGHRLDAAAVPLASGGDALYRGVTLALRAGQGVDHGPGHLRMVGLAPKIGDLLQPRIPVGPCERHVVQPYPARHQAPPLGGATALGLGDFGQRQIVMGHVAFRIEPAVKAHFRPLASRDGLELGHAAKTHDVGPEPVRNLEVSHRFWTDIMGFRCVAELKPIQIGRAHV